MNSRFSINRFISKSFCYHWRINLAVTLGVAIATAVVTGALLVGDSMRGSLRSLTLERLGKIDFVLLPGGFVDTDSATNLRGEANLIGRSVPAIFFSQAVAETMRDSSDRVRRAGDVQVIATDPAFWDLDSTGIRPSRMPVGDEVVLNEAVADELGVQVGDLVTLRLPVEQAVPADSPLGKRDSETEGLPRLKVVAVVPGRGLGRFSLQPNQQQPLAAWVPIELVQDVLDREGQANAFFIDATFPYDGSPEQASAYEDFVAGAAKLRLTNYGLKIEEAQQNFAEADGEPESIFGYYSLSSDRLMLPTAVADAVVAALGDKNAQPVMTYLANAIEVGQDDTKKSVPYSIITAIDPDESMPLDFGDYDSADGETPIPIVINNWTADQLQVSIGDEMTVYYFEPETSSGKEVERSFDAILRDVVPITEPATKYRRNRKPRFDQPPTVYNDPWLTPTVPGVTDQDSMDDWDLPFPLERERSREDDLYWDHHRLTPKAFIPLDAGQRLFGSRFGNVTSLKIRRGAVADQEALENVVTEVARENRSALGFRMLPIRAHQLAASRGTTPFDALFLSLSFFVIFAALMLVALLFRLGLEQRASEYGTLLAVGLPGRQIASIAMREGAVVAVLGSIVGVIGGIGYAAIVLHALRTWWVGAVTVPFLRFHASPTSLVVGMLGGTLMAAGTLWWTSRRLRNSRVASLLSGRIQADRQEFGDQTRNWTRPTAIACLSLAIVIAVVALGLGGQAQAGAFVGGGMMLLIGIVLATYHYLQAPRADAGKLLRLSLFRLAMQNARRNPLRSTLSIGLLSVACFLIISMSAFQLAPTGQGVGGFDLIARASTPIYRDLGDSQVLSDLLGPDARFIEGTDVFGFRLKPGQDASCNNLYQASRPQVLGVSAEFARTFDDPGVQPRFGWIGAEVDNPWTSLDASVHDAVQEPGTEAIGTEGNPVPIVVDQNTAMWALQMYGGVGEVKSFDYGSGDPLYVQVVGLLAGSVLQGSLLMGEANFERVFPEITGYQFYLMRTPSGSSERVAAIFEDRLGDVGMDVTASRDVLARLLAVQNTYLRTFQGLGALGLLLGTFGLAVVQMRSILERRGELAVMRATGFRPGRLGWLVLWEQAALLIAGIASGAIAGLAAVIPYMLVGQAKLGLVEPATMLSIVFLVGLLGSTIAVARVVRLPVLESLRS